MTTKKANAWEVCKDCSKEVYKDGEQLEKLYRVDKERGCFNEICHECYNKRKLLREMNKISNENEIRNQEHNRYSQRDH